jgi:hypothetical protein
MGLFMGKGHSTGAKRGRASDRIKVAEQQAAPQHSMVELGGPAPDGLKRVEVSAERVRIQRRIAGLDTWVNVPTSSYRGVTLRAAQAVDLYEIALLHMDPGLAVVLSRMPDDTDMIALWRSYGRALSLPLLAEDQCGRLQPIQDEAQHGPFCRRSGSPLKSRRPRFLAQRRSGFAAERAVHRGEAAISFGV